MVHSMFRFQSVTNVFIKKMHSNMSLASESIQIVAFRFIDVAVHAQTYFKVGASKRLTRSSRREMDLSYGP